MALVRWEPVRELGTLQGEVNRLFDSFFGGQVNGGARRWIPAMDLAEGEDSVVLRADLPGLDRDDVSIEVKDGVLTVAGERSSESAKNGTDRHRVERAFGRFSRSLVLPDGVRPDQVAARFENGVLEVTIPKPEERKPHRVEIEGGSPPAVDSAAEEK